MPRTTSRRNTTAKKKTPKAAPKVEYINIKAGAVPGRIKDYTLNGDRTVAGALKAASLEGQKGEIRINRKPATLATILKEGDTVILLSKIAGA